MIIFLKRHMNFMFQFGVGVTVTATAPRLLFYCTYTHS